MIASRRALAVLGVIPMVAALGVWATFGVAGDDQRDLRKAIEFALIGGALALAAFVAQRSGARWWTPAWVLGASAAGVLFFYAIFLAMLAFSDDEGGCPGGRIYC